MPLFDYKGKDGKGEITSGSIEADSNAAAQAALKSRGIYVVMLRPGIVKPTKQMPTPSPGPSILPGARPIAAPTPGLAPSRDSDDGASPLKLGLGVFVLLLLLGGLGYAGYRSTGSWGEVKMEKNAIQRTLEIKGRVTFDHPLSGDAWRYARVTFVLPEIPAEMQADRSQLEFNAVGDFSIKMTYLSVQEARIMNVRGSARGFHSDAINHVVLPEDLTHPVLLPPMTLTRRSGNSATPSSSPSPRKTP